MKRPPWTHVLSSAGIIFGALAIWLIAQPYNGTTSSSVDGETTARVSLLSRAYAQSKPPTAWSPTKPYPVQTAYYPGTEELARDEMRVVACGTGMPQPRLKQAAACFLVELGNGDKFIFDMGEGSFERLMALGIPLDQLNKVFLGHLHLDHAGDFPALYFTGPVNNRLVPVRLWGPEGSSRNGEPNLGPIICRRCGPGRERHAARPWIRVV